ncbi:Cell wall surface anchor family protein [Rhodotorula toruloides ATCC 204091]|uniref:Cell wall surface anchor family protein n=1 Tax=Rhodotorula toruloides TaxID=5286 RepID=A0A0K3CNQ7_RHOTO|nr:Cell wall surface anchor family protein [Rhodotorula toruloides ATCC 204091]KAK4335288.1 Cell wall surface anchor family protein [Rhodotorula toruloides]PRQ71361.1 cell wall surface anchor family protein [Rhodotorula toruloides]
MDDSGLPSLPPPVPPTHSRSLSSSSSDDNAGSPQPAYGEWGAESAGMERSTSSASENRRRRNAAPRGMADGEPYLGSNGSAAHPALSRTFSSASTSTSSSSSSFDGHGRSALSKAAISAADVDFPRSASSLARGTSPASSSSTVSRSQSLFAKVSPSLANHSPAQPRFASTSTMGIYGGGRPPPSPSTSSTASREEPTASPTLTHHFLPRDSTDSPAPDSPTSFIPKPLRPPKSEARWNGSAPNSPIRTDEEGGFASIAAAVGGEEGDSPTLEPRRRLRARPGSSLGGVGGREVEDAEVEEESVEQRRERRSRRAEELKEKNQRILDSINSSSASRIAGGTLTRSSTASTIRDLANGQALLADERFSPAQGQDTWLEDNRASYGRSDEFGRYQDAGARSESVSRSRTLGDLDAAGRENGRALALERRSQTYGNRSGTALRSTTPLDDPHQSSIPDRAASSFSNYASTGTSSTNYRTPRRSELVGSARTRAASAFGGTAERDEAIQRSLRNLASKEALMSSAERRRVRSESKVEGGSGGSTGRNRPALPREFLPDRTPSRAATSLGTSRPAPLDLDLTASASTRGDDASSPSYSARHRRATTVSPSYASSARSPTSLSSYRPQSALSTPSTEARRRRREWSRSEDVRAGGARSRQATFEGEDDGMDGYDGELERTPKTAKKTSRESGTDRMTGLRSIRPTSRSGTLTPPPPPSTSARSDDRQSSLSSETRDRRDRMRSSDAWRNDFDGSMRSTMRSRASGSSGDAASARNAVSPVSPSEAERERTIRAINALLAGQGIVATAAPGLAGTSTPPSSNSSPSKRQSASAYAMRMSSVSGGNEEPVGRSGGTSTGMSRSSSITSSAAGGGLAGPPRLESALRGLIGQAGPDASEHHKLLLSALDHFDKNFSAGQTDYASQELVKRMTTLVSSTTKLNSGLRGLVEAIKEEQVQAQLDEDQRSPMLAVAQVERNVNALLRTSDDQVRSLTEDLVAFVRFDRERDRARRGVNGVNSPGMHNEGDAASRPTSRASTYRNSVGGVNGVAALHSPPRRATTASPYDGATVSHASAKSPALAREVLRSPLVDSTTAEDRSSAFANRRHTMGYAASGGVRSSAFAETPSPANRRESAHVRSPLSIGDGRQFDTPSRTTFADARRQSLAESSSTTSLAGLGLPLPSHAPTAGVRQSKTSDTTVRPPSPSHLRFPTMSPPSINPATASSFISPTRMYSDSDGARALQALEAGANLDEGARAAARQSPTISLRTRNRDLPELPANASPEVAKAYYEQQQRYEQLALEHEQQALELEQQRLLAQAQAQQPRPPSRATMTATPTPSDSPSGRKSRLRISSGGLGAALKNAFTPNKKSSSGASDGTASPIKPMHAQARPSAPPQPPPLGLVRTESRASMVEERRAERRKEVEGILRRAGK